MQRVLLVITVSIIGLFIASCREDSQRATPPREYARAAYDRFVQGHASAAPHWLVNRVWEAYVGQMAPDRAIALVAEVSTDDGSQTPAILGGNLAEKPMPLAYPVSVWRLSGERFDTGRDGPDFALWTFHDSTESRFGCLGLAWENGRVMVIAGHHGSP